MPQEDKENETPQLRRGKTVEQIYQKKTQLEHILLRPDTYVGSCEHQFQEMYVFDEQRQEIVYRKIDYVPALYKIFDEILVNAADNSMRDPQGMNLIDITIDKKEGWISVMNNGKGVPVVIHKEHKCYVPELIFGHLLTSDNYDDGEKKVTGGRNGYGAKLTNVFSKKFIVETADKTVKQKFQQVFEENMSVKGKPKLTPHQGSDYTKVTFWPDFKKFGMTKLDDDIAGLMMKRAYDIAGSSNKRVKVNLNGKQLKITNFEDYVKLYLPKNGEGDDTLIYERCNDRWEIAFSLSDNQFSQVSFVNSINTIKGGTHVAHVTDQLVDAILKVVKSKNRGGMEIKPAHVRNHLFVFLNVLIENPAFDSQTKETLTTKQSKFGSSCELPEKLLKQVMKSGVVDMILDWAKAKMKVDLGRSLKGGTKNQTRILGIPKLEDANDAGGKNSQDCTLILTEGDSAKSLAVAGLSVVGRDHYGVFPLRGKVLNVRDGNFKQITENKEIQALLKIMGLDSRREYDSPKGLRYGSISIMTDQDFDGSHIKGLLINLVQHWWPSLLKVDGFLKEFVTPIVKVWKEGKKDGDRKDEKCFFTVIEYEKWKKRANGGKGYKTKYYKGLGTSTSKEAKEYFKDIENHEIDFKYHDKQDFEAIDLAFNKKRADDRKEWINGYTDGDHVDHSKTNISYYDFIHKELVQFAKYDVYRSVPCMVDGFKPSQRKVLFAAFKKKLKNDIKVAQFVGYVSEQAAYHHGEVSLENTIVNMAQNYVGSNNVNLFFPSGQFGTRLQGGKDHAAARYIYTRLNAATRHIFHPEDDAVLKYLDDEGQRIEPDWYCPVLPLVLINGADGIGTGWSTFVPNYNPRDLINNIRKMLRGEKMTEMTPWYKGFRGAVVKCEGEKEVGKYEVVGCIEKTSPTTLSITELPVRTWTQNYKEFLEELMPPETKKSDDAPDSTIIDFREFHTENSVHFEVTMSAEKMKEVEKAGLEKTFKMRSSISITNMVLFDQHGKIGKYNSAVDILTEFCHVRRKVYDARKAHMVAKLTRDQQILSNKARFILMVVKGELELRKRKRADILKDLQKHGFKPMSELDAILEGRDEKTEDAAAPAEEADADKSDYDYLLNMNLWSLTYEKVEELKKLEEQKKQELDVLKKTSIETMWDRDLEALAKCFDEMDDIEAQEAEESANATAGRRKKDSARKATAIVPKKASRKRVDDDEDFDARKPLQEGCLPEEVQKTTWGSGALRERRNPESNVPADGVSLGAGALAVAKVRKRGPSTRAETEGHSPPVKEPAREEIGGASLLARLMSKTTDSVPARSTHDPVSSSRSFSSLGGADDIFAYLHSGKSDTPYSALDDFGGAPFATAGGSADAEGVAGEDAAAPAGKKGRGRPKAAAGEAAAEDAMATKKRRAAE
jgi:DNA topoisomerase-2